MQCAVGVSPTKGGGGYQSQDTKSPHPRGLSATVSCQKFQPEESQSVWGGGFGIKTEESPPAPCPLPCTCGCYHMFQTGELYCQNNITPLPRCRYACTRPYWRKGAGGGWAGMMTVRPISEADPYERPVYGRPLVPSTT